MTPDAPLPDTILLGGAPLVHVAALVAIGFVLAGFLFATVRLIKGPSLPDRVVALDLISVLMVCFIGAYAIVAEEPAFLDAAIALALIAFLATVAFARYAESQAEQDGVSLPRPAESRRAGPAGGDAPGVAAKETGP